MQIESCKSTVSRWPHRLAVVLACATFPLLWVGGLVTTTDAGMAVPDWPNTFGYNLFLYPWQTWLAGPWDIFIEHGHRMLGAAVGMITLALAYALWRGEARRWVRWLGLASIALVVFQGVLGGMRVLLDERTLAMVHGCTGPLFFGLAVAVTVITSRRWQSDKVPAAAGRGNQLCALALVTCVLVYLQIVLGAILRHVPVATEPMTFALAVRFHLFLAAIVSFHALALIAMVLRQARYIRPLGGLACSLLGLLLVQLTLGAGTWMVKFAPPTWIPAWASLGSSSVQEGGWLQTHVITAHVAVGSLMFITTLALALYAVRFVATPFSSTAVRRWEAAV